MEWINLEDRKPEEDGEYLLYWGGVQLRDLKPLGVGCYQVAYYFKERDKFVDPDGDKNWRTPDYWMELPGPPKQ